MSDSEIVITLMIFEEPTTQVEVFPYYEKVGGMDSKALRDYAAGIPDLKGIEILTAAAYQRLESVGGVIDSLPEDIDIFGGVAVGDDQHS